MTGIPDAWSAPENGELPERIERQLRTADETEAQNWRAAAQAHRKRLRILGQEGDADAPAEPDVEASELSPQERVPEARESRHQRADALEASEDESAGDAENRDKKAVGIQSVTPVRKLTALKAVVEGSGQGYSEPMPRGSWRSLGKPVSETCTAYASGKDFKGYGCINGLNAWTTAVHDGNGNIYFRGGGHWAYEGNEIYRFSLETGEWKRVTDSGRAIKTNPDGPDRQNYRSIYDDGSPASGHHYGALSWADGNLVIGPYAGFGANISVVDDVWEWNPADGYTQTVDGYPNAEVLASCSDAIPGTSKVLISSGAVRLYDAANNSLSVVGGFVNRRLRPSDCFYDPASNTFYDFKGPDVHKMVLSDDHEDSTSVERSRNVIPRAVAYHAGKALRSGRVFMWNGDNQVYTVLLDKIMQGAGAYTTLTNDATTETPAGCDAQNCSRGVFGKWWYIESLDVFVGIGDATEPVWVYRPPEVVGEISALQTELESQGYTCSDQLPEWQCSNVQGAINGGGEVSLPKGDYRQCATVNEPTTLDMNGARIKGVCGAKATFIQDAQFTLKNVECFGAQGGQGNEACVRRQAGATTVQNVHFHDSYNGIIGGTGDTVLIEDSEFGPNLGGAQGEQLGRAHGIYIKDGEVLIRNSTFHKAKDQGHLIKAGAARTLIENSVLDERGGNGSRVIDAYNGGELILRDVTIHASSGDGNKEVIGWDLEGRVDQDADRVTLDGLTVYCDSESRFLRGDVSKVDGFDTITWPNGEC